MCVSNINALYSACLCYSTYSVYMVLESAESVYFNALFGLHCVCVCVQEQQRSASQTERVCGDTRVGVEGADCTVCWSVRERMKAMYVGRHNYPCTHNLVMHPLPVE